MTPPTVIGNLAAAHDVVVDRHGRVASEAAGWSFDWLAGAADRWHVAADASGTAVTQRRVDGTPVVETSMRVPGGQLVHRAWCVAAADGRDVVVVEIENRSKEPVALAAVLDQAGAGRLGYDGQRIVTVDGRAVATLGRVPARVATGGAAEVRSVVTAGEAANATGFEEPAASAAFVFPLPHTARLRFALAVAGELASVDPDGLPDAEAVVRGWRGHLDAGARVGLPDDGLEEAVIAARSALLVQHDRDRPAAAAAGIGRALEVWGHHAAAAVALAGLVAEQRLDGSIGGRNDSMTTAEVLAAWAAHSRVTVDAAEVEALAGPAAKAAHRLGRRQRRHPLPGFATTQLDVADLLDRAGQPEAAALCRERAAAAPVEPPAVGSYEALMSLAAETGGVDVGATACFLLGTRDLLVDDREPGTLAVVPTYPDDWLGREVEAHRLPTRAGLLSFAIRWHGPRPALLWEVADADAVRLTTPGLDPAWSTGDPVGEALLAPVEPAGGLPKVVAPLPTEGTPVDDAPDDGVSFR